MVELRYFIFLEESCTLAAIRIYKPVAIYDTGGPSPKNHGQKGDVVSWGATAPAHTL